MPTPFQTEAWSEYAIGMCVLLARITARCTAIGLNWDGDDYFSLLSVFFWTVWKEPSKLPIGVGEN